MFSKVCLNSYLQGTVLYVSKQEIFNSHNNFKIILAFIICIRYQKWKSVLMELRIDDRGIL